MAGSELRRLGKFALLDDNDKIADSAVPASVVSGSEIPNATNGQVPVYNTSTGEWEPGAGGGSSALVDAKGDLLVATANDTLARVAVGADGQVLAVDPSQTAGVVWDNPPGSAFASIGIDQSISGVFYNTGSPVGSSATTVTGLTLPYTLGISPVLMRASILVLSGAAQDATVGIWNLTDNVELARSFMTFSAGSQWGRVICDTQIVLGGDGTTEKLYGVRIAPYATGTTLTVKGVAPFTSSFEIREV